MTKAIIYALDFDGVICDSAVETAMTGWKAASSIWPEMPLTVPTEKIDQFRLVRPMIETGYEAILAMRLLFLGKTVEAIYGDYHSLTQALLQSSQLTNALDGLIPSVVRQAHRERNQSLTVRPEPVEGLAKNCNITGLKYLFGQTRDEWIANDLADWIAVNPLFAGIAEKLQNLNQYHDWYVITTKQERFVKHILQANGIELAAERIFGLDRRMSKVEVLLDLAALHSNVEINFVEDRLPTLINVKNHSDLKQVKLIFATWGYNTDEDKCIAQQEEYIMQTLDDFL